MFCGNDFKDALVGVGGVVSGTAMFASLLIRYGDIWLGEYGLGGMMGLIALASGAAGGVGCGAVSALISRCSRKNSYSVVVTFYDNDSVALELEQINNDVEQPQR